MVSSEDGFLGERDRSIMEVALQLTGLRPQQPPHHGPVYHLQLLHSIHAITLLCKVPTLINVTWIMDCKGVRVHGGHCIIVNTVFSNGVFSQLERIEINIKEGRLFFKHF